MNEIDVADWQAFQEKLEDLRNGIASDSSPLLFRGQANSEWQLKTTLERAGKKQMKISAYYELISRIRPAVETVTEAKWEFPDYGGGLETSFVDYDAYRQFPCIEIYRYMVYLRH